MSKAIPQRFNLARHCLEATAISSPDKLALVIMRDPGDMDRAERWTYGELERTVRSIAAGLIASGLNAGDRLLLRLPNNSDYALLFFGAIAAGIIPIPVSSQLTADEAAYLVADASPSAIALSDDLPAGDIVGPLLLDETAISRLKQYPPGGYADTAAEDPAYLLYTSGTTSRPKGVLHAQRVALGRAPMHSQWQGLTRDDVMLHAGAFNWSYTLGVGLLDPWSVGATAVLYTGSRDITVWPRLIVASGATIFATVPSLLRQILKYNALVPEDFGKLRHTLAAGEALSPALLEQWEATTGRPLYEAFGMSECSTFISSGTAVRTRPGSPGKPQAGRRVALLPIDGDTTPLGAGQTGLIAIHRSEPGLMLGYWNRPDEDALTWRGDWFVGGDLAQTDEDGYVWHQGRADDVMNAGGYRVSPLEVETALGDCPGVAEIAVREYRPRPDVAIIAAYVVRRDGSHIDEAGVLAHASKRLASYKQPKQVFFVDALPRSANGKLLRRALG
jgi:acyl-coenzyme A synthetase/AMP-(fatty) acid ligase